MMPTYTNEDAVVAASKELIQVLQNDTPSNIGQTETKNLTALASIFNKVASTMTNKEANQGSSSTNPTSIQPRVETMKKAMASTGKQIQMTN